MKVDRLKQNVSLTFAVAGVILLLASAVHAEQPDASGCACQSTTTQASPEEAKHMPRHGRVRSVTAPPKAVFGMIWNDTRSKREYIFDGNEWVPHDNTVDNYYAAKKMKNAGSRNIGGGK